MLDDYKSDLERAQSLQNILIATATGSRDGDASYRYLRTFFINVASYNERRFIWQEFTPFIENLEGKNNRPLDASTSQTLKAFDQESIHAVWQRALDRRTNDPEGAITAARTLSRPCASTFQMPAPLPTTQTRLSYTSCTY